MTTEVEGSLAPLRSPVVGVGRAIADLVDSQVLGLGFEPQRFYREHGFRQTMWRVRTGRSFASPAVMLKIIACAEAQAGCRHAC